MQRYNPKDIEPKWQAQWEADKTYQVDLASGKQKYVGFGMFNYPSGAGIHIGHGKNFTLPDVIVRAKRQQGYEAYMPVGFDSFGLPAENYAIRTGTPPRQTTDKAIANYHTQYRAMGWSMDWSKEIDTSTPEYYRWTQWIFTQLFEQGLAYQKESAQWWCPQDMTVLANEQVEAGKCWRCGHVVEKKLLKQWFFKITDYADEILDATDDLDWTESVKTQQKNWIGRSVGAEVDFALDGSDKVVQVFTTRPDTLFGATFLVVAPEHPLVAAITSAEQKTAIDAYVAAAQAKSDVERQQTDREKTGVFTGAYAVNPVNGAKIPVWTADYVLAGYGTGAIMAVPAHDDRDNAFAKKFELPIMRVVKNEASDDECSHDEGTMINSGAYDGIASTMAREKIVADLAKKGVGRELTNYKMRDWLISRQRYWGAPIPIIHCPKDGAVAVPADQLPVLLPELESFEPSGDGRSPLGKVDAFVHTTCPKCGGPAERETDTMDGYACSSWYFLRYIDPHNEQAAWDPERAKKWMPTDFYNGGDHAIAHLLYARFFMRFFHKIGLVGTPEPFQKMYFHGKIMAPDGSAFSKTKGNGPDPLKLIAAGYGADSIRTYIMFISPADMDSPWSEDGVPGCYRFLQRIWALTQDFMDSSQAAISNSQTTANNAALQPAGSSKEVLRAIHKTIKKVDQDILDIKLNTAVAAMMECVNELYKLKASQGFAAAADWRFALESLLQLVAPFAPHMSEELWHQLGHSDTIHIGHWPKYDEHYLVADTLAIAVQINGKLRGEITVPAGTSEADIVAAASNDEKITGHLSAAGNQIRKTIYVPGKLVNFVV